MTKGRKHDNEAASSEEPKAKKAKRDVDTGSKGRTKKQGATKRQESDDEIDINRAPVLTLWVSVVAERLGFSTDEAYTYGRWVSSSLAATRGRKVESTRPSDKQKGKTDTKGQREEHVVDENHVNVFAQMKIPVKRVDGQLFAIMAKKGTMIKPETVRRYLEKKFGDKLQSTHDAMMELAQSLDADDVRNRAYELLSEFKPETNKRGAKGHFDLEKLHNMAFKAGGK
ncbi:hypothetical protein MPSEU_000129400 [Mayamaea pseudoterrestris]|nr:hypothetical protein MPSEU_000129400 [Mayamaea pseudoterrestris]